MNEFHTAVMLNEVVDGLNIKPGQKYIDATIGGGGHGLEILKREGILLGIDADPQAINYVKNKFRQNRNWKVVEGNFKDIKRIARENGFSKVAGILFDLGVSSYQLDTPERGFSYRFGDAPLKMRLDNQEGNTAADLISQLREDELYEIFAKFGEEEKSRAIVRSIIKLRRKQSIKTTGQLASAVRQAVDEEINIEPILSRVFQGLRIAVNQEMEALKEGLRGAEELLDKDGILAVISFHSLEDRQVKLFLKNGSWKMINKKPIRPSSSELMENRRSRSAKLRIAIKI